MKKPLVSIIIVHYKVPKELLFCISSIINSKPRVSYEIIVVDNDKYPVLREKIKDAFYIPVGENVGFGEGNNIGAKAAKGDYLFFLNPDTEVLQNAIEALVSFLEHNKQAGIVAPLLLDSNKIPYQLQGSTTLTPFIAITCLSFVKKLVPTNFFFRKHYLFDWDKKSVRQVAVVPGTAFMIRREIFRKIGGFDKRFFLFFEENDICMRVQNKEYAMYIDPSARVMHVWGQSTKQEKNIHKVFKRSRFLYFQKHFGTFWASLVEVFCR